MGNGHSLSPKLNSLIYFSHQNPRRRRAGARHSYPTLCATLNLPCTPFLPPVIVAGATLCPTSTWCVPHSFLRQRSVHHSFSLRQCGVRHSLSAPLFLSASSRQSPIPPCLNLACAIPGLRQVTVRHFWPTSRWCAPLSAYVNVVCAIFVVCVIFSLRQGGVRHFRPASTWCAPFSACVNVVCAISGLRHVRHNRKWLRASKAGAEMRSVTHVYLHRSAKVWNRTFELPHECPSSSKDEIVSREYCMRQLPSKHV